MTNGIPEDSWRIPDAISGIDHESFLEGIPRGIDGKTRKESLMEYGISEKFHEGARTRVKSMKQYRKELPTELQKEIM